jgi:hypothetical protein
MAVRRQLRLLGRLGRDYDNGNTDAAYLMSTVLRTLLEEGPLLGRVLKLRKLRLVDTADTQGLAETGRLSLGGGLTLMSAVPGQPGSGQVVPRLGRSAGLSTRREVPFRDWWNRDLVVAGWAIKRDFTRRYVVIEMVNTDGGAHVDHERDADYVGLHGPQAKMIFDGQVASGSVAEASVRQVAWELLETLMLSHPYLIDEPEVHQESVDASRAADAQAELPNPGGDASITIDFSPLG